MPKNKENPKIVVECDGCGDKFDVSDYDNIASRHPHYSFAIESLLDKRCKHLKSLRCKHDKK